MRRSGRGKSGRGPKTEFKNGKERNKAPQKISKRIDLSVDAASHERVDRGMSKKVQRLLPSIKRYIGENKMGGDYSKWEKDAYGNDGKFFEEERNFLRTASKDTLTLLAKVIPHEGKKGL